MPRRLRAVSPPCIGGFCKFSHAPLRPSKLQSWAINLLLLCHATTFTEGPVVQERHPRPVTCLFGAQSTPSIIFTVTNRAQKRDHHPSKANPESTQSFYQSAVQPRGKSHQYDRLSLGPFPTASLKKSLTGETTYRRTNHHRHQTCSS